MIWSSESFGIGFGLARTGQSNVPQAYEVVLETWT